MPFKSSKQRAFLFAKHPDIAKRWAKEFPNQGKLPKYAHKESLSYKVVRSLIEDYDPDLAEISPEEAAHRSMVKPNYAVWCAFARMYAHLGIGHAGKLLPDMEPVLTDCFLYNGYHLVWQSPVFKGPDRVGVLVHLVDRGSGGNSTTIFEAIRDVLITGDNEVKTDDFHLDDIDEEELAVAYKEFITKLNAAFVCTPEVLDTYTANLL